MLGQLNHLTGYEPEERSSVPLVRFWDWLMHLDDGLLHVAAVGVLSIVMIWALHHTRLKSVATLIAIVVITGAVALLGWADVPTVRDMSIIPRGLPEVIIPDLSLVPELITTAFAIAILAAVQSAALIQATPNPGGKPNISRDFVAMGVANIVGGFMRGMPSCASLSRTAVNVSAGAKTRLSNIFAGLFVGLILILFGGWIERIPLAVLAGHLVVAAASLIKPADLQMVWRVGPSARAAMVVTLVATLLLPLQYSIYIGVGLSLLLYIYTSSEYISVGRLNPLTDGRYRRGTVPAVLPPNEVVILSVSGNMYFAAIRQLVSLLPDPSSGDHTIVVLRMRENRFLGSTGVNFLLEYAAALEATGGRLLLSGVSPEVRAQLERTDTIEKLGAENVFFENDIVFDSTGRALERARSLLRVTATATTVR
jgi:SulP family sulfate permease